MAIEIVASMPTEKKEGEIDLWTIPTEKMKTPFIVLYDPENDELLIASYEHPPSGGLEWFVYYSPKTDPHWSLRVERTGTLIHVGKF